MKTQGIYLITNIHTAEMYVGSSVDVQQRWSTHKRELRIKTHKNTRLQKAWDLWGAASFQLRVIESVEERTLLESREQHYLQSLQPVYNETLTARRAPYRTWRSDAADKVRFWSKVNRLKDGCWEWNGTLLRQGYGCFKIAGKMYKAHRVAYELSYGLIPEHMVVCHKCDNPRCVRPDHLFVGTHKDNTADMLAKGRGYINRPNCLLGKKRVPFEKHYSHLHPELFRGSLNPRARLTGEQVEVIRERYARKDVSQSTLAKEYGVAQTTISAIVRRLNWQY